MDTFKNFISALRNFAHAIIGQLPLIMIAISIMILLFCEFDIIDGRWKHSLELISTTLLGGGFFTLLTKTSVMRSLYKEDIRSELSAGMFQKSLKDTVINAETSEEVCTIRQENIRTHLFSRNFQEILEKTSLKSNEAAMLTDNYLGNIGNPTMIWDKITLWLAKKNFPEKNKEILHSIRRIMPHKVANFQEEITRDIYIGWRDQAKGILLITVTTNGYVTHNHSNDTRDNIKNIVKLNYINGVEPEFNPDPSTIGGKKYIWNRQEPKTEDTDVKWYQEWEPVCEKVQFHDSFAFTQDINSDNEYKLKSKGYINGITATVTWEKGLYVHFIENGGAVWEDLATPSRGTGSTAQLRKSTHDLLFAQEGFTLLIRRECTSDCPHIGSNSPNPPLP